MSSFLLVSLNIDAILAEITPYQRKRKLEQMTKGEGLGDAYAATISRIKGQQGGGSKLGMEVLLWVSHSERPLHVDELCDALGVEKGSKDLNIRNIPAIETLLACTLGLVIVERSSSTVRLVHYTLQEYLSNPNLFITPHSMIAEVCLTYLNFGQVRGVSPTVRPVTSTFHFLEYASCYWGSHAKRETTERVKVLALKLLYEYDNHISLRVLLLRGVPIWHRPFDCANRPRGFTGLHGAAYFGCVEIIVALLEVNRRDMLATDLNGNTALVWAAWNGHEEAVGILLGRNDANPNISNKYGQTPLHFATENGHEGVVRILLGRNDVDPNTANIYGRTPLSFAAEYGHGGVVGVLLKRRDVNPNIANIYGQTPLMWAARNGHGGVVRILLERNDVNPNTANIYGRTPLSFAAEYGHEGAVRTLLQLDSVNPGIANQCGKTPLSFAAENGHGRVVRMLLERDDVNPNTPDECGRTPLSFAAERAHEGVMRILLARKDANPNTTDAVYHETPLIFAAGNGYGGAVGMPRGRGGADLNRADQDVRGQLSFAAESQH